MTAQIALWHAEHASFARLLDLLEAQVAEFHDEGTPDFALMLDIVSYLREYPDRVHHAREDAAFACMMRRDPQMRPVINRLVQEHRVIAAAGEELQSQLAQVVADAFVRRETLEAAAAIYLAYYRNHLNTEERDILPHAARILHADDWKHVATAVPHVDDPLFGEHLADRYRGLRERVGG